MASTLSKNKVLRPVDGDRTNASFLYRQAITPMKILVRRFTTRAWKHSQMVCIRLPASKPPAARTRNSMERVMYNTVLGALPMNKRGGAFYYSNYHPHARKTHLEGAGNEWPCCSGTLPQIAADYHVSAYFRDQSGVFVNLYIPSTVHWDQHGAHMSLTQSGQYPLDDRIAFQITAPKPTKSALRLRIPAWTDRASVNINGRQLSEPVKGGTFLAINREWKDGDRIDVVFPRHLELKAIDSHHPNIVAVVCGPLVLFTLSDDTPKVTRAQLLSAIHKEPGSDAWHVDVDGRHLQLRPFWAIKDETYFTYLSV